MGSGLAGPDDLFTDLGVGGGMRTLRVWPDTARHQARAGDDPTRDDNSHSRAVLAGVSIVLVVVVLGLLGFRALGESRRIAQANGVQDERIQQNFDRLLAQLKSDCAFKLDVSNLPAVARAAHTTPSPVAVRLAEDARRSFIKLGCPDTIDPRTGKIFGPPPPVTK